ncbi:MAG: hypothetical protein ABFD61_07855 [Chloroherpetonaceae bacterium]|jgi:hypothetical protein|nr:hypothetical protein [Bacteroidota bacterium]
MKDIFEEIERDDLTPDLGLLADAIGIEPTRDLLRKMSGMYIYIPRVSRLEPFILKYMKKHTQMHVKEMALILGVSSQYLLKLKRKYDL